MPTITKTKILVKAALSGQKDKAGVPKYEHCVRVKSNMDRLLIQYGLAYDEGSIDFQHVALLHDIIEDSDITSDDLFQFG